MITLTYSIDEQVHTIKFEHYTDWQDWCTANYVPAMSIIELQGVYQ